MRVETVCIEADCAQLVGALERVLPQRGYRTLRSFDLSLATAASHAPNCSTCAEYGKGQCNCRYAVLLVFANQSGMSTPGVISVQGTGGSSVVSLLSVDDDSDFAAQFTALLIEALGVAKATPPGNMAPR